MPQIPTVHFEAASTLAVVMSSHEPLLFLSSDLRIIAASASFCQAFEIDPGLRHRQAPRRIGQGDWAMPGLQSLLLATVAGSARIEAYEIDLHSAKPDSRQLIVNARTLERRRPRPHSTASRRNRCDRDARTKPA